jgi:hypothetical protein
VVYRSFSRTMIDFLTGVITAEELCLPDVRFLFGCMKSHAFQPDGGLPYEATWANKTLKTVHQRSSVTIDEVDPDKRETLKEFYRILEYAAENNKIEWRKE